MRDNTEPGDVSEFKLAKYNGRLDPKVGREGLGHGGRAEMAQF
jgi:hypothetical protein